MSDLTKLISHYGSDSSRELMLCGNYSPNLTSNFSNLSINNYQKNIVCLDSYFINDKLGAKCQNLNIILLEYLDLSQINFELFENFKNLKKFSLKWCNLSQNWFQSQSDNLSQTKITQLHLIRSGKLSLDDVKSICQKMPHLSTLSITQAQSTVSDEAVEFIVNSLNKLEHLELTNTSISDNAIFSICNSPSLCKNLKHLNLSMSSCLTNSCLLSIAENLRNLKSLYLTSCFGISNVNLLQNFINLNYLNLNNTSIDREKIRNSLLPVLPKCEIEFGHEKMLNRKLMWTINGSRNCVCSF